MKKSFPVLRIIQVLSILLFASCTTNEVASTFSSDVKVALRDVGHQLLWKNNDSTSLVLPVIELNNTSYQLVFEKDITFDPSDLNKIVAATIEKAQLPKSYVVEVIRCSDTEIAYSYTVKEDIAKNIIPCGGRVVPLACYTVQITFINVPSSSHGNSYLFYFLVLLVLSFLFFIFYSRYTGFKKDTLDLDATALGIFIFYPEQLKLVKAAKDIPLTQKECELLEILVAKTNQVVTREELTKRVWEDHGVIVGRSLDTYISKLRKKLQDDATIKIVNIHGVGYRLELY